jgi:GAF domain-containing protein
MLYRRGSMIITDSGMMDYIIVPDEDIAKHLQNGWSTSQIQAASQNIAQVATAIARAALEEKAKSLNIKFDGRTSDAKLAANIEAAINGLDKT